MSKLTYQSSHDRNQKLRKLFSDNPELIGELIDAGICNDIAFDLYQLRKKSKLTQDQLAELAGVKQSNISRWETPGYQGYKIKVLSKLVRLMGGVLKVTIERPTTIYYVPLHYKFNSSDNYVVNGHKSYRRDGINSNDTHTDIKEHHFNVSGITIWT